MPRTPSASRSRAAALAALILVLSFALPTAAQAASGGVDPQPALYPVDGMEIARTDVSGFGGGTIFTPEGTGNATLGAVIVTPGFTDTKADMRWYGTDLAARGFVVFTIDTLHTYDLLGRRATEMLAAADYLTGSSPVKARIDPSRIAVLGYSLGGGGVLKAAEARHTLSAAVALMPVDAGSDYSGISTPTLIITGKRDRVGVPALMGHRMYSSLPPSTPREYLELAQGTHASGERTPDPTIRTAVVDFLERYLDGDTAYSSTICPAPAAEGAISTSASYCGPTAG